MPSNPYKPDFRVKPPGPRTCAAAFAVFLGCTTACRLAAEWQIGVPLAYELLRKAAEHGLVDRVGRGCFAYRTPEATI